MFSKIKIVCSIFLITIVSLNSFAQEKSPAQLFWNQLQAHCGKAYEGSLILPEEDEAFGGKRLVMHVISCSEDVIKIPFFVGDDRSRTWVLTYKDDKITLEHDHRHKDGTEDEVNFYGGTSTNSGNANIQFFPANEHTQEMIPYAATNVWWITLDETSFTYNLKRLGTDRIFKVSMDLTKEIATPEAPWGWQE